ncbi:MAG: hypothetical protein EBV03_13180, partial [Proteobacteria bacterium]|nr:hypothetical protein [Pseudomonadota bacterium]
VRKCAWWRPICQDQVWQMRIIVPCMRCRRLMHLIFYHSCGTLLLHARLMQFTRHMTMYWQRSLPGAMLCPFLLLRPHLKLVGFAAQKA